VFSAGILRNESLAVGFDPITTPPDINPHHGQVWGNYTKGVSRKLAREARWFVPISDVDLT
jgi:hypothetical protein